MGDGRESTGGDIVCGDSMTNNVDSTGEWDDQVDPTRPNGTTTANDSTDFTIVLPQIIKEIEDPNNPGVWLDSVVATVGDVLNFRIRINTNDGSTPIIPNIIIGNLFVRDLFPDGVQYNNDAVESYSNSNHFSDPDLFDADVLNIDGPPEIIVSPDSIRW